VTLPFGAQLLARATYLARTPLDGITDDPLSDAESFTDNCPDPENRGRPKVGR
jgi:multicomponent Na+:H+ antiporter subunit G